MRLTNENKTTRGERHDLPATKMFRGQLLIGMTPYRVVVPKGSVEAGAELGFKVWILTPETGGK